MTAKIFLVEESTFNFFPLLIVFLLAFLVPLLLNRFRVVPVVVGEIIAGVVIGVSGLGIVQADIILAFLGDIGLTFLMFLAGLEIDFDQIFKQRDNTQTDSRSPLINAMIAYGLTLTLAAVGAIILNRAGMAGDPWLLAFILSATSLGVLMPVLKEKNIGRTKFGQAIFLTATISDFITVILLTIYLIIQARGLDVEIFSLSLLFLLFFIAYRLGIRYINIPRVRRVVEDLSRATVQIKVRGAIAIMLGFVVLAEFVNAELILGAFLAGMVISLIKSPQDDKLVDNLEAFGFGFFIPVFFILVGVNLDLVSLWESPQALFILPLFFLVALGVKVFPMVAFRRSMSIKQMLAGGILLNTHLSLEIAVAVIGIRTGLLSPSTSTVITLFAITTVLFMPIFFNYLIPKQEEIQARSIAICSAGPEALSVARELVAHDEKVIILDDDIDTVQQAQKSGFAAILIDQANQNQVLDALAIKGFLALCSDDQRNLKQCQSAKSRGIPTVVARVNDPANLPEFRQAGIQTFVPTLSQTIMLAMMVRNPGVFSILTSTTDDRDIREITLHNQQLIGRSLHKLALPGDVLVLSIRRENDFIIPHGNVQVEYRDRLTVLGCPDELEQVAAALRN